MKTAVLFFSFLFFILGALPAQALQIARPLVINGCTGYPEGSWGHCCVEHDIMYWIGGTFEDRKAADEGLLRCVDESGGSGQVLYNGVRIFGIHAFSKAWPPRSLDSLNAKERQDIQNEWDLYTSIGQPLDFEFIIRESIVFEPLNAEKRKLISEYLTKFAKTPQYQNFLSTYQSVTGRKPETLKYHR